MSIRKRTWTTRGENREAWIVDYVDQHGERHIKTFARKKEADAFQAVAKIEVSKGTHTAESKSITVTEAAELWLKHCEAEGLERSTIKQRREHLRLHIAPFIGTIKLSALTAPRVHAFVTELRENDRSLAMRRKVLTNLKTILGHAMQHGMVAQNVALEVKIKADAREQTGPMREGIDYPSMAEIRQLIDTAKPRWRALVVTAVFTALRASELRGLRWHDVDLDHGILHVRQRADLWQRIGPPKSKAGARDIPLAPMVVNTLKQWREHCPASSLDLVFASNIGSVMHYNKLLTRVWHPLQVECFGQAKYGLHALRHAAASLFIANLNWTPKRIQTVMGHANIAMTYDRYGHLFENREDDREAMRKLEAAVLAA